MSAALCPESGHPSEFERGPGSPQSIRRHFAGCREGERRSRERAEDMEPEPRRYCPDCRRRITTAWNGGRCLDCHEARLGPDPCGPGCDIDCPHS